MSSHLIGVVSDTHGLLRPEAIIALQGVEMILHAGDIGKPEVLEELCAIAPLTAIRGNNDKDSWANSLSDWEVVEVDGVSIYMLHDLKNLDLAPEAAGYKVVISGHSHKALIEERRGVMYLNPGSIGPRRFKLPISLAYLRVKNGKASAEIMELSV